MMPILSEMQVFKHCTCLGKDCAYLPDIFLAEQGAPTLSGIGLALAPVGGAPVAVGTLAGDS